MITNEMVMEYLGQEGYRYKVDEDGDICFKYEGLNMIVSLQERDRDYFRIMMPCIYQLEDNRIKVLEAINEVCKSLKAIKAFLVEDYLWIAIEMFTDSTPELEDFMPRCMQILKTGREMLAEEIFKD